MTLKNNFSQVTLKKPLPPRCGYISIIGKPNVGKSTLINQLAEEKKVITARRAQTTVFNTTCLLTFEELNLQCAFVDTPGINLQTNTIAKSINKQALQVIKSIDLKIWVLDVASWSEEDEKILSLLQGHQEQTLVLLNKIDKVKEKNNLLPLMTRLSEAGFKKVLPHQALKNRFRQRLLEAIYRLVPEQEHFFSEKEAIFASKEFQVRQVIREKCLRYLGQEVPYKVVSECEKIFEKNGLLHLYVRIDCPSESQKRLIIGQGGQLIKQISTSSRVLLEKIFKKKIFLKLWVKVNCQKRQESLLLNQFEINE